MARLEAEGYVESADELGFHELCPLANAVKNVRFVKPIPRLRADEICRLLIERIEAINADGKLVYFVEEVVVFGSYADPAADEFGDIDLVVVLSPRPPITKPLVASRERVRSLGRRFSHFLGEYLFGQREVLQRVKGRSPYLSLHADLDLSLATYTRILFRVNPAQVAPHKPTE